MQKAEPVALAATACGGLACPGPLCSSGLFRPLCRTSAWWPAARGQPWLTGTCGGALPGGSGGTCWLHVARHQLCPALLPVPPLAHTPAPLSLGQAQALGAALGVASRGAWPSFTRRASVLLSVRMVGLCVQMCLGVSHRWVSRCLCVSLGVYVCAHVSHWECMLMCTCVWLSVGVYMSLGVCHCGRVNMWGVSGWVSLCGGVTVGCRCGCQWVCVTMWGVTGGV